MHQYQSLPDQQPSSTLLYYLHCRVVQPGQTLAFLERVRPPPPWPDSQRAVPAAPPLEVVFEDEHLACIVKPQGVPTQVGLS